MSTPFKSTSLMLQRFEDAEPCMTQAFEQDDVQKEVRKLGNRLNFELIEVWELDDIKQVANRVAELMPVYCRERKKRLLRLDMGVADPLLACREALYPAWKYICFALSVRYVKAVLRLEANISLRLQTTFLQTRR
jgi:hypothetical protein